MHLCHEKESFNSDCHTRPLRIAIVTENFLPKVDGVTRTLSRLLQYLREEGHEALLLGPESGMKSYEGHNIKGTRGIPLLCYPGLSLNFFRPMFLREVQRFDPDVIHYVDPIWLGCQTQLVFDHYLEDVETISSYHTNLAMYADMYNFSFLTEAIWKLSRHLHSRCTMTFCPSPSTKKALEAKCFTNIRLWPRGVDVNLFNPERCDLALRAAFGAHPSIETKQHVIQSGKDFPPAKYSNDGCSRSKVVITYVGRISWEKNLALLVEAFKGLEDAAKLKDATFPGCVLQFVGDGPAKMEIEKLCSNYGITAIFCGYRKGEELARCYGSSDIFAFPSFSETFGQVVLEALASGLPVVGLRAEGVRDLVQHERTGLLLDLSTLCQSEEEQSTAVSDPRRLFLSDSPSFAVAVARYRALILDLTLDTTKRAMYSEEAVRFAHTQSWSKAMSCLLQGYREVAAITRSRKTARLLRTASRNSSTSSLSSTTSLHTVVEHWPPEDKYLSARALKRLRSGKKGINWSFSKPDPSECACPI